MTNHPATKQKDLFSNRYRAVRKKQNEAADLHIPLVAMLRWCIKPNILFYHAANGEHRDPRTAAKLKAMGVLPGVSDLEFFWRHEGDIHVLFLELKLPGRQPTDVQIAFGKRVEGLGASFRVAHSLDEAIDILGALGLIKPGVEVCGRRWP